MRDHTSCYHQEIQKNQTSEAIKSYLNLVHVQ